MVGESGSGKTTVAETLKNKFGYKIVESYTTRAQRYADETGHIFVTEKDYEDMKDDICALTVFDRYKYWATNQQVDESDIYIIDPAGIKYFKEEYKGHKTPVTVHLKAGKSTRKKRMLERGDTKADVRRRIKHDKKAFKDVCASNVINANMDIDDVVASLHFILNIENFLNQ